MDTPLLLIQFSLFSHFEMIDLKATYSAAKHLNSYLEIMYSSQSLYNRVIRKFFETYEKSNL